MWIPTVDLSPLDLQDISALQKSPLVEQPASIDSKMYDM